MAVVARPMIKVAALALFTTLTLAGCGGANTSPASTAKVDLDATTAFLADFQKVGAFPVTEPLGELPAPGSQIVFLEAGTSVSALQAASLKEAAEAMRVEYKSVSLGRTAESINSALNSVVEMKPAGVIAVAVDPVLFSSQLEALRRAGTVVVGGALSNGEEFGFGTEVQGGPEDVAQTGEVMAATALAKGEGKVTEIAYYKTPELAFTTSMENGVREKLDELCDGCNLRVVDIPIAQVGNAAPQTIVSDLQANPKTQAVLVSFDELQVGLPAAMNVAGIKAITVGQAPSQANFEAINNGQQDATVAWDIDIMMWTMLDQMARKMANQELSPAQKTGILVKQVLTKENVPADATDGWNGYPDYAERFKTLWNR